MRASKKPVSRPPRAISSISVSKDIHISGAEGIYKVKEIQKVSRLYIERALNHPRGKPDKIVITIEEIKQRPKTISSLPLSTVKNLSPLEGEKIARKLLHSARISMRAIQKAFSIIKKDDMRGASIITAEKGSRLEPDRERGIRVSRFGISDSALKKLSRRLAVHGINNETVKEALALASKVSSCEGIIAEICASDDPDYTTGYVASKQFGYIRIPNIKNRGSMIGGRVFFVKEGVETKDIIEYLERRPVIIGDVSLCKGIISLDELLHNHYI